MKSNLKELLENRNPKISARKLADLINHNRESVRKLWNDTMADYPGELIAKVCLYLGCMIDELLEVVPDDEEDCEKEEK